MTDHQTPDQPVRAAMGMYKRFALGGVLIVVLTATAVATAGLLQVKTVVDSLRTYGHQVQLASDTIAPAQAGKPQTILLVGSDHRYGHGSRDARSDTLMLVRLDPHQQATAVLSIPRDLLVQIPGHGQSKINAAYSSGGLDLTTRTVKQLLGIKINHVVGVNFKGFKEAVDFIHCVYVDVDRRYYHSNAGLPPSLQYAEIDIQPGYQRLCGSKALDYVRFRHLDNDIVRAARQQEFLRQASDQVGTSSLLTNFAPLARIFAKSTEYDSALDSEKGILRLIKLAAFSTQHPIREVHFPAQFVQQAARPPAGAGAAATGGLGDYVTASPEGLQQAVQEFLHAKASAGHRPSGPKKNPSKAARRHARRAKQKTRSAQLQAANLVDARRRGEDLVATTVAQRKVRFPVYFPTALTPLGQYPQSTSPAPMPYVYDIVDRAGRKHEAYRLVVQENVNQGQYYGIEGTTWRSPPILAKGGDPMRMAGRTYRLFYDGTVLRLVAWTTPRAVYWVSNTLSLGLTNKQMLGIARSLTRFGAA